MEYASRHDRGVRLSRPGTTGLINGKKSDEEANNNNKAARWDHLNGILQISLEEKNTKLFYRYIKLKMIKTSHVTRSGNRACFVPRVNSFAIKSFFYTGIKQWNALPSTTQLLTNKQAFKSEVKKLLSLKLIQMDEEVYLFY